MRIFTLIALGLLGKLLIALGLFFLWHSADNQPMPQTFVHKGFVKEVSHGSSIGGEHRTTIEFDDGVNLIFWVLNKKYYPEVGKQYVVTYNVKEGGRSRWLKLRSLYPTGVQKLD